MTTQEEIRKLKEALSWALNNCDKLTTYMEKKTDYESEKETREIKVKTNQLRYEYDVWV